MGDRRIPIERAFDLVYSLTPSERTGDALQDIWGHRDRHAKLRSIMSDEFGAFEPERFVLLYGKPVPAIRSLHELLGVLQDAAEEDWDELRAKSAGLPWKNGEVDYTDLPIFSDNHPDDTGGIWSYDNTYQIVSDGMGGLCIEERDECDEDATPCI